MDASLELELDRVRDRIGLDRLRAAVRVDHGRSAMIYTDTDLATWIGRCMVSRGARLTVAVRQDGGLHVSDGDADGWAALRRALETGSFD